MSVDFSFYVGHLLTFPCPFHTLLTHTYGAILAHLGPICYLSVSLDHVLELGNSMELLLHIFRLIYEPSPTVLERLHTWNYKLSN